MLQRAGAGLRRNVRHCVASLRRTFADHIPLSLCTLSFAIVAAGVVAIYRLPFPLSSAVFFLQVIGLFVFLVAGAAALTHLWRMYSDDHRGSPLAILLRHLANSASVVDRFCNIVHGLLAMVPLMMMFSALKPDIVLIRPFMWDATLMRLGTWMGFGTHYWRMLQPLFGHPVITAFLNFNYNLWFPLMFGCLFWQLSRPQRDFTRLQFLLSFGLAWFIGGFVLATIFSSAGPAFYSHVVPGPNPYAPLLHYLRATSRHWPVWTVNVQDMLWHSYITGTGDVEGISAMPSLHVTIATLMTLLAWRYNRTAGIAFTAFTVVILIGSIMLGWHYSSDGLAGIALAFLFWGVAGKITQMWAADCARSVEEQPTLAVPALSET
jgi:uncharacterized membrane protein YidH (DUF202 family)